MAADPQDVETNNAHWWSSAVDEETANKIDQATRARLASVTGGLSPAAAITACVDWALHLAVSPGKQLQLLASGMEKAASLANYAGETITNQDAEAPAEPPARDRRFNDESWQRFPYNVLEQSFLLAREWSQEATTGVDGVSKDHEAMVAFLAHQVVDALSPYNIPFTNPEVIQRTLEEGGANLQRGVKSAIEDAQRKSAGELPEGTEDYQVGKDVACSPGKVVFRNRLAELIQYSPTTDEVLKQPMLIVPPWIMKYYVLDLSPKNSMVKYLVEQGHTVFMLSWKNPDSDDRDLDLNDYLKLGIMDCLDAVNAIVPGEKVNGVGYCAGGTLLAMAAATMARDGDDRWNTITTFTAQTDCADPGEIKVFLNDSQLSIMKELMRRDGYMDGSAFSGAFNALNPNALIWQPFVERYLLGEERKLIDLMAWNTDVTRVPYKTHYTWLKEIFLENALAEDQYRVGGEPIHLSDIRVPMCFVATTTDHVAPWKSVYKIHRLAPNAELTFVLTTGGHNAGIACGPKHPRRKHQIATRKPGEAYVQPKVWHQETPVKQGSWWPSWDKWLKKRSDTGAEPPSLGRGRKYKALEDAPGSYVRLL